MRVKRSGIAALVLLSACAPRVRVPAAPAPPRPTIVLRETDQMAFTATAYCRGGKTASGVHTTGGIVAADPEVLPIGTRIRISGLKRGRDGVYRVMDTGTRVQGRRVDVFVTSCREAKHFGRQPIRVAVIR